MRIGLLGALAALIASCAFAPLAEATFPGKNGKIAIVRQAPGSPLNGIWTVNPDGSGMTFITSGGEPDWAPRGKQLAFRRNDGIYISHADGTGATRIVGGTDVTQPAWSPDGNRLLYLRYGDCDVDDGFCYPATIYRVNKDGTGATAILTDYASDPQWSPDGSRIAYHACDEGCPFGYGDRNVRVMNASGSGVRQLTHGVEDTRPEWAPNGTKLLFESHWRDFPGSSGLELMNPDGSGKDMINSTVGWWRGWPGAETWAPDGTTIAAVHRYGPCDPANCNPCTPDCDFDVFLVDPDGTGVSQLTNVKDVIDADWQSVPVAGYPRPRAAGPVEVSLVPAYNACTSPNRMHGPPLAYGSCNPPTKASDEATLGAPENGKPVKGSGLVRLVALNGDVRINVEAHDLYDDSTLADYAGELRTRLGLRITDKRNSSQFGGPEAGTVSDTALSATVPCGVTLDAATGSSCLVTTTANTLAAGAVTTSARSVWELSQVQMDDGGADGDADTAADNTLFMVQGVFVP